MNSSEAIVHAARSPVERAFERIIGNSVALESVLQQVVRVAPTDSTVLIQGETGTGKELIAHAIHNVSARCGRALIKLNCAAIPFDLLESELFGYERGAFTGAIGQKIGRFEMAHQGTLFLDEVGDIPPALQPKLLRVLQEQEFERLGSVQTHHVDVRLVAATNRDLSAMVDRGEFRSDLYYRLNVFAIQLPPLRSRREDIAGLVDQFVNVFSRRMGKEIDYISPETMVALVSYPWPGNVRELENMIERAVILANYGVLPNPLPGSALRTITRAAPTAPPKPIPYVPKTLKETERDHIRATLAATGWVIGGSKGAATLLGLKRTTLINRMKRLGIQRPSRRPGEPGPIVDNIYGLPDDSGRIIMIGSAVRERAAAPELVPYAATKGAVKMFAQALSREVGSRGITVNNIQPGPIDTDLNPASGDWAVPQKAATAVLRKFPVGALMQ